MLAEHEDGERDWHKPTSRAHATLAAQLREDIAAIDAAIDAEAAGCRSEEDTMNSEEDTMNSEEDTMKKKITKKTTKKTAPYVLVRTYSAGVHVGTLVSASGERVVLRDASRVWRWRGANTLHELSLRGPDRAGHTRISERVAKITLTEAIEIIPVAADQETFAPVWL